MRYQVLQPFRVRTSEGERELLPGQIIFLDANKAFTLLSEGKIFLVERAAVKVYSKILKAYLWVVADDTDARALRASARVTDTIYTGDEIQKLRGMDEEGLKRVHEAKTEFPESTIQDVAHTDRRKKRQ
jgi:hypothetical protein